MTALRATATFIRLGSMAAQLLEEVHAAPLDPAGRDRLRDMLARTRDDLRGALTEDLPHELDRLAPAEQARRLSEPELRIRNAKLVGWIEGLLASPVRAMEHGFPVAVRTADAGAP